MQNCITLRVDCSAGRRIQHNQTCHYIALQAVYIHLVGGLAPTEQKLVDRAFPQLFKLPELT